MFCLRNIAMRDYQESVTIEQTHRQTDAGQNDPYVLLCFAGNTKKEVCVYVDRTQLNNFCNFAYFVSSLDFRCRLRSLGPRSSS